MNIDLNILAAEITRKIQDEISKIRICDFGEVKATYHLSNGGWTAEVLLPGAETTTNPLNCLSNYIPSVGDWVMVIYPPKSQPVLIDCTPMVENTITTPDDKYAPAGDATNYYTKLESDNRYYTKTDSDEKYSPITHNHDNVYAFINHTHDVPWIWTNVTPLGSWTETQTGHNTLGYYKDPLGVYHFRGRVTGGSLGDPIMQLSVFPDAIETRAAVSNNALAVIEIRPDGKVVPVAGDPSSWISLDGISIKM